MTFLLHAVISLIIIAFIGAIVLYLQARRVTKHWREKMADLDDCPFNYRREFDDHNEYVVFDLCEGVTLWSDYGFGIRPDGIYGIRDLKLKGINGDSERSKLRLKIGQSIFPIMLKMEEFEFWAATKAFKTSWDWTFTEYWKDMKENLDNLRYLEHKSREQDKNK